MEILNKHCQGAINILIARAFYNTDGTVSILKVSAIIGIIGLGVFFCPTFLTTIICLGLFAGLIYLFIPVVRALFNGKLTAAADATAKNKTTE